MRHILALACGAALMLANGSLGFTAEEEYRVNKKPQEPPPLPPRPAPQPAEKAKRVLVHLQRWLRL